MSIYAPIYNKGGTRKFNSKDWRTLCEEVDRRGPTEVSYEFSNGRKFTENFRPTNGPYES
jgi:hypothetical protein